MTLRACFAAAPVPWARLHVLLFPGEADRGKPLVGGIPPGCRGPQGRGMARGRPRGALATARRPIRGSPSGVRGGTPRGTVRGAVRGYFLAAE